MAKRSKLNVQVNYEHVIYMWFFSLVKLWVYRLKLDYTKASNTDVFKLILWSFPEHILWNNCRLLLYWVVKCIMSKILESQRETKKEIHTGIVKLILFSKMLFKSKNSNKETKESFHVSFIVYILNAITSIIERFKNKKTNFLLTFLFYFAMRCAIWYHLYNFKKSEKHSWRSVTFSKVAG